MTVRVLVADDQPLIRVGFTAIVSSADDMEVVGEAVDGADAVRQAHRHLPDVVLMDIRMPGTDGLSATGLITKDPVLADVRVLVVTTFETDEYLFSALQAGASGFLGKGIEPAALIEAIRVVAAGDALLSPAATKSLVERYLAHPRESQPAAGADLAVLTPRERETVALVAHGLSNDDIAGRLFLSSLTVKTHVNRAMSKLGVRDRAQLVVLAYQAGLVHVGE